MRTHRPSSSLALAFVLVPLLGLGLACKTRDPQSAGLLEADAEGDAPAAPAYTIECVGVDGEGDEPTTAATSPQAAYRFDVETAALADPNGQPDQPVAGEAGASLTISVVKTSAGTSQAVATAESGQGSVASRGMVVVSFAGGVLSAEPVASQQGMPASTATHVGILTLLGEGAEADGLPVRCVVAASTSLKASRG